MYEQASPISNSAWRWGATDIPDQTGRRVLVTGANSGLGLQSARVLAEHGAHVLIGARNPRKGAAALEQVRRVAAGRSPDLVELDLADLASVAAAADEVSRGGRLDLLVLNAGVLGVPPSRSADGFELHFATNYLGHFALTARLLPALQLAPAPRVVSLSSLAHWIGRIHWDDPGWPDGRYHSWLVYAESKLANLLFAAELDRRARAAGSALLSVAAHPGMADTPLSQQDVSRPGPWMVERLRRPITQPVALGAVAPLCAATARDVAGGDYVGPRGRFGCIGPVGHARRSATARDPQTAARLWALSERLTGTSASLVPHPQEARA